MSKKAYFYGVYELNGEISGNFYHDYETWFRDTFCPETKIIRVVDLIVHGDSYEERKADTRSKAMDFQALFCDGVSLFWSDLATFNDYFETYGKRYGLLEEFKENAVC